MAVRLRSRWHQKNQPKSLADIASVVGFNCWKIATEAVLSIESQGFTTTTQADRLAIVAEFVAFLLQVTDRWSYENLTDDDERQAFISNVAQHLLRTYVTNRSDIFGANDNYADEFVTFLNQRGADYAELHYIPGEGGFAFMSFFGAQVEAAMHGQRWVSEYIIDMGGPEALESLHKNLRGLFE